MVFWGGLKGGSMPRQKFFRKKSEKMENDTICEKKILGKIEVFWVFIINGNYYEKSY
jgi:hypothetical protein